MSFQLADSAAPHQGRLEGAVTAHSGKLVRVQQRDRWVMHFTVECDHHRYRHGQ